MTYEENKKLIESAKELKEYCRYIGSDNCKGCLFLVSGFCELENVPNVWKIPKLSRWTPEDVALAKALKAFGAIFLEKEKSGAITVHFNNGDLCEAPVLAFKGMPDGSYHIDNIIKEAEG